MRIVHIVGARPNFMKIAPIIAAIDAHNAADGAAKMEQFLVHTGQHYDREMSQDFFDELGIPEPDINLGVGSGSHAEQTAGIMVKFEKVLLEYKPHLVIVVGDVNSTIACALTAKKLHIKVAHVEAGLRSGDMTMPEEVNRRATDAITDLFFTTDTLANENLLAENVDPKHIFFVGNVMIDTLMRNLEKAEHSTILDKLGLVQEGGQGKEIEIAPYAVLTLHRPANVDDPEVLRGICSALEKISETWRIVFPCHPRTAEKLAAFGLDDIFGTSFAEGARLIKIGPLGYLDFLRLNSKASAILTDSGGIQEESTILQVPCLTLRNNTERPVTVTQGTNSICGNGEAAILVAFQKVVESEDGTASRPEKWDGNAAERIVKILAALD